MNKFLFDKIYSFTLNNKSVRSAAVFLAQVSKYLYYVIYALGFLILFGFNKPYIVAYIAVPFVTLACNWGLRKLLNKPRPFADSSIEQLVPHDNNGSFPSNHAASSMIISLSWLFVYAPIAYFLVLLSVITGLSRIMTGVHYPLDVVCGWLIAFVFAFVGFGIIF